MLFTFLLTLFGAAGELLLIEHVEGIWQTIPLFLMGLGLFLLLWYQIQPSKVNTQIFRLLMVLFMASGILGFALHFNGNRAFELEMYPSMKGWTLIWETLKGATPVLAPGTMIAMGLLGWGLTLPTGHFSKS